MKDILIQIIGLYTGDTSLSGLASLDVPWILSAVLLTVCVYCTFRIIGLIFTSSFGGHK